MSSEFKNLVPFEMTAEWLAEQRALVLLGVKRGWIKPPGALPEAPAPRPAVETAPPKKKRATG